MKKNKPLIFDAILWIMLMMIAGTISFQLLMRDKHRQFGAVSLGGFPTFRLKTIQGEDFNEHSIKAGVWAVHRATAAADALAIAKRLVIIEQQTVSGKRHLNVLSLVIERAPFFQPLIPYHHIVVGTQNEIDAIFASTGERHDSTVYLVDQDGIIRGKYDFDNVDDYRKFQQDLALIL